MGYYTLQCIDLSVHYNLNRWIRFKDRADQWSDEFKISELDTSSLSLLALSSNLSFLSERKEEKRNPRDCCRLSSNDCVSRPPLPSAAPPTASDWPDLPPSTLNHQNLSRRLLSFYPQCLNLNLRGSLLPLTLLDCLYSRAVWLLTILGIFFLIFVFESKPYYKLSGLLYW